MELTFPMCESIVNTLPIGLYTGRRIGIEVDKSAETSAYDLMEDKIRISYPIIAHRMNMVKDGSCNEEEAVRSMVYHEVAHAIMTPSPENIDNDELINIFEDERIETVLQDYFYDVRFRKQLYDIHGGHAPKATDAKKAFFNAVRFGLGTGKVQKEINRMIKNYAPLNPTSERYYGSPRCADYERDVHRLYDLISQEFKSNPDEFNEPSGGSGEQKQMDSIKQASGKGEEGKEESNGQKQGEGENKDEQEENGNNENEGEKKEENKNEGENESKKSTVPRENPVSHEELKRMVGASLGGHPDLNDAQVQKLNDFQRKVEIIIGNFNKKNKGGSGINTYSGVFNPRATTRPDYRFFERSMTTQGNNRFGTCHLNLIIDCSGSFCRNVPMTNGILQVLSEIERKNRNFSMDVGFINHDFRLCETVSDRKMVADGGNDVPDDMKEILMKLQKPNTCNYNIILFDGDALCNGWYPNPRKTFGVFDMKQTTLITDPENEQYMKPPFTSTKVVVTRNYTDELIDHILHALTIAFG